MQNIHERNKCDRCGATGVARSMSFFNTDWCCHSCTELEAEHPLYEKARERERAEMIAQYSKGLECNFEGIGLPSTIYKVKQGAHIMFFTQAQVECWGINTSSIATGSTKIHLDMEITRLF